MNVKSDQVRAGALFVLTFVVCVSAFAQTQRTFVSSTGLDTSPCSRTAPCRTFNAAMAMTLAGGEVVALESAGYGPVTITTNVSIVAPAGVYAGITAFSGNAITVTGATLVLLKGLTLVGIGGDYGINATGAGGTTLHVEKCDVSKFNQVGILTNGTVHVFVDDTVLRANVHGGISMASTAIDIVDAAINRCRIYGSTSGAGLLVTSNLFGTEVVVSNSVVDANVHGIDVAANALVMLKTCVVSHNSTGVFVQSNGVAEMSGCSFVGNTVAVDNSQASAAAMTFKNNEIVGPPTQINGALSSVTQQ